MSHPAKPALKSAFQEVVYLDDQRSEFMVSSETREPAAEDAEDPTLSHMRRMLRFALDHRATAQRG